MKDKIAKYRINELLNSLTVEKNKQAITMLPGVLGISVPTFNNYRNIGLGDNQDIPHTIVAKLEKFFDLQPGELQNFTIENIKPITQQTNSKASDTAALKKKFNLTAN